MRQIILDTETTGLSPKEGHRVVEIGCVELFNRRPTGNNFHVYVNPERDMPEEAFRVHGLSQAFLVQHPPFAQVASKFTAYVAGAEIIIHNADFDAGFLDYELKRAGRASFRTQVANIIDTVHMARVAFPGKRASLDALCDRFAITRKNRTLHGALLDAQLLAEVYIAMTRGQESLLDEAAQTAQASQQVGLRSSAAQPVIELRATEQERDAHQSVLRAIEKASKKTPLWHVRAVVATLAPAPSEALQPGPKA